MLKSGQSPQATCQFPMRGLMKNVLTVTGSGCVALGHPARPPKWLPETGNQGGRRFRTLFRALAAPNGAKDGETSKRRRYPRERGQPEPRARRACQWRTTLPEQCRADAVSKRRNRGSARRCRPPRFGVHVRGANLPGKNLPGKSLPNGSQGSIRLARRRFHVRRLFGRHRPPRS